MIEWRWIDRDGHRVIVETLDWLEREFPFIREFPDWNNFTIYCNWRDSHLYFFLIPSSFLHFLKFNKRYNMCLSQLSLPFDTLLSHSKREGKAFTQRDCSSIVQNLNLSFLLYEWILNQKLFDHKWCVRKKVTRSCRWLPNSCYSTKFWRIFF